MSKSVSSESEISLYSADLSIRQVFNHGIPQHLIAFPCSLLYIVFHGHHLNKRIRFVYMFVYRNHPHCRRVNTRTSRLFLTIILLLSCCFPPTKSESWCQTVENDNELVYIRKNTKLFFSDNQVEIKANNDLKIFGMSSTSFPGLAKRILGTRLKWCRNHVI